MYILIKNKLQLVSTMNCKLFETRTNLLIFLLFQRHWNFYTIVKRCKKATAYNSIKVRQN